MFIDANIFLEMVLKDKNHEKCRIFIQELLEKKKLFYTSDFIIYSCLLTIWEKLKSTAHMKNFLIFMNSIGMNIIKPSLKEMYSAAGFMGKYNLDFDDALVVSCMDENKLKEIATYGSHFNKIKNIAVIHP